MEFCFNCTKQLDDEDAVFERVDGDPVCSAQCRQRAKAEKREQARESKISDFTW